MTDPRVVERALGRRFILEAQIGAGGMGAVFRADDVQTGQKVAVKVLKPHSTPQEAERFAREAKLLAGLHHPHIVSYIADGLDDAGQPYLVMEWLEGEDLAQCLQHRKLTIPECVLLLLGASAGLAEAHHLGVIHRDLKPSNLFLCGGDPARVMLLDYGIARHVRHTTALTRTGMVVGTPEYMSPEQARGGRDVGPSADIFSLGCVLHECLTGRPPFSGDHLAAVLLKVLLDEAPALEMFRGDVPVALSDLLKRMLRKDPQERIPNGQALHDALRRLELPMEGASVSSSPTVLAAGSLTPQEQQIFSVAVAVSRVGESMRETLSPGENATELALQWAARDAVMKLGARVEILGDGTIVATVLPSASASDQASLAARCGLLLREYLPTAEVAVATGRGLWHGQMPVGEVAERALDLLKACAAADAAGPSGTSVFIDELTEGLLGGRFDIVHGEGAARLLREIDLTAADDTRKLLGGRTPYVGREQELGTLAAALTVCIDESMARAVGVIAPPGMGKSRLRFEFLRSSEQHHHECVILLGRGDMTDADAPYGILGQALRRHCGVLGGEPVAVQQARLSERLRRHLRPDSAGRVVTFVAELCGVPFTGEGDLALNTARSDPRVMHDQVTLAFMEWLRAECKATPVLLVLEDLHWGDALTVSLVARALRELEELPLFILTLARPEAQALFPAFFSASAMHIMPLRPLSRRACERLAVDVLRRVCGMVVNDGTIARIVAQSAGNPLFLEELIRAVGEGRSETLPESILAMMIARLSQFDPVARQALRAASVFGENFAREGLATLIGEGTARSVLDSTLSLLVRAELIEPQSEASLAGQERYRFRHALVRDAAYSLLTAENRVAAHRLAGGYLEVTGESTPAVLADHARKGQELDRAARFYLQAASHALASHDLDATSRLAVQALDCGVQDEQRGLVQAMQALASYLRLDMAAGADYAIAALEVLRPGSLWWCHAIRVCFYSFFMIGRTEHLERLTASFFAATPDSDARGGYLEAGSALLTFFHLGGMRQASESLLQQMCAVATEFAEHDLGYLLFSTGFHAVYIEPDPFRGLQDGLRAVAVLQSNGDRNGVSLALFCVGMNYAALGAFEASEAALREARTLSIATQSTFYATVIHLHLAFVLADQPLTVKQAEARSIGEFYAQAQFGPAVLGAANRIMAQVRLATGELESVGAPIQIALDAYSWMLLRYLQVAPLHIEFLLRTGDRSGARLAAEAALKMIDGQGGLGSCEVPVRLALARACLAEGDAASGQQALAEALVQMQLRADRIPDPALRESYLNLPTNHQILVLAREAFGGA